MGRRPISWRVRWITAALIGACAAVPVSAGAASAATAEAPSVPAASASTAAKFDNELHLSKNDAAKLQSDIDAALAKNPNARQISQYEIAAYGGAMLESFSAPGQAKAPAMSKAALELAGTQGVEDTKMAPMGDSGTSPWTLNGKHYYCLYAADKFDGRRLQWADQYCYYYNASTSVNLSDWDFDNQTTSWVNNSDFTVYVYDGANGGGSLLWSEGSVSNSPNVGTGNNDRATSLSAC